jgi:flotillin
MSDANAMLVVTAILGGVLALVLFLIILGLLRSLVRVCPSNQVLVVTGGSETVVDDRKYGFRIQKGGWTLVIPFIQSAQAIDLTILPINVRVEGVNSANGIAVGADATACVCVNDMNDTLLYSAVQQLLGKSRPQIKEQIQQTMVGNFRAALNKTTPLQAIGMVESAEGVNDVELADTAGGRVAAAGSPAATDAGERAIFRRFLLEDCRQDLSAFGMEVVSVSLQRIWDDSNYIANLANKTLSRKRQEVEIEEARLRARAEQAESDASRRMLVAESGANERILARQQEVELYRRQCDAEVRRAELEADSGIAQAANVGQRQVQEMRGGLQVLKNRSDVTLAAEAQRRCSEIQAGGQSQAVEIVQQARNALLQQKVDLLQRTGDKGKIALFITQLPALFQAYQAHAEKLSVNEYLVLSEEDGFNIAVNRGPAAMVDFMHRLEEGFGISVKGLLSTSPAVTGAAAAAATAAAAAPSPSQAVLSADLASAGVKEA